MTLNRYDPVDVSGRWKTSGDDPKEIIINGSGRWMHLTTTWPGSEHGYGVGLQSGTRIMFAFWDGGRWDWPPEDPPGLPPPGPAVVLYHFPFLDNPNVLGGYWALTTEGAGADVALRAEPLEKCTEGAMFVGDYNLAFTPAGVAPAYSPYTIELRKLGPEFAFGANDKATPYSCAFNPPPNNTHAPKFSGLGLARSGQSPPSRGHPQLAIAWGKEGGCWRLLDLDTNRNANDREWVTELTGYSYTMGKSPEPISFVRTLTRQPPDPT
jgi:hypothetical protein